MLRLGPGRVVETSFEQLSEESVEHIYRTSFGRAAREKAHLTRALGDCRTLRAAFGAVPRLFRQSLATARPLAFLLPRDVQSPDRARAGDGTHAYSYSTSCTALPSSSFAGFNLYTMPFLDVCVGARRIVMTHDASIRVRRR